MPETQPGFWQLWLPWSRWEQSPVRAGLSHICYGYWQWPILLSWLYSWLIVEDIKYSIKWVKLIFGKVASHMMGGPCFYSLRCNGWLAIYLWFCWCWGLFQVSLCWRLRFVLFDTRCQCLLWWCYKLPYHLTNRQHFVLWIEPSPLHSSRFVGWELVLLSLSSPPHLLVFDVTNNVY